MAFPALLVFDLDGTLIDSRLDLVHSVNAMLIHLGRPTLPGTVIAGYIGDGAEILIRRALGDPEGGLHGRGYIAGALSCFLEFYRIHKLDHTTVYEGVLETLSTIQAESPETLMAVLTNKPVNPSREICTHFGLDRFFFQNYGGNSFATRKPDPLGLETLIAEASAVAGHPVSAVETVMIGDSDVDVLTARNAGARSLACTYGFAPQTLAAVDPDALAYAPAGWLQALQSLPVGRARKTTALFRASEVP